MMKQSLFFNSFRLRVTLLVALFCTLGAGNAWADPVTIYSETFGTPSSNTNISSYTGWSALANMFNLTGNETVSSCYSGNKVGTGEASSTNDYSSASGSGNAYQQGTANTTTTILTVQKINISGKSSLSLSFAIRNGGAASYVNAYYQIDNGSKTELTLSGYGSTTGWHYVSTSISGTGTNLKLFFEQTPTKGWTTRIDDILLTGIASGGGSSPSFTASDVNIAYSATQGSIAYTVNNAVDGGTVSASVKTGDWLTLGQGTTSPISFSCSANSSTSSRTATVTLTYTYNTNQTVTKDVTITQAAAPQPSISADNVNIAYDATNGSIGYTLNNGTGNVSASVTSGDWLTLGTITESAVPFTCSANTSATARTAQVTLSYTGASNKVVTVTQAAAPLANIAALVASGAKGRVQLTNALVTYKSGTTAYIEDESGAIMLYQCASDLAIGDKITGVMNVTTYEVYNGLPEIKAFTLETGYEKTTGNTVTPTEVTIATLLDNNTNYSSWISRYVVIKNATVTSAFSSKNSTIEQSGSSITLRDQNSSATLTSTVDDVVNVTGNVGIYNSTKQIALWAQSQIVVVQGPTIAVASSLVVPNYVAGTADPVYETLTVNGSNLTADITLSLGDNSDFEMSEDLDTWTNTLSLTQSEGSVTNAEVAVRLKAGLSKGSYDGTLTLSTEGAQNVTVNLSGSVTGQTYEIAQYTTPATAHGTITFAPASPVEDGTEVTLTAEPADGYEFTANSWVFYKEDDQDFVVDNTITVTNSKITMPAYALYVDASFAPKTTFEITTIASHGTVTTDDDAWEGKTVTVLVEPATGYSLASIVVTKTGDSSTKVAVTGNVTNGFTFTMPAYAVTVTVTFAQFVSWNLAVASYDEITDDGIVIWSSSYATMENSSKTGGTSASNYLGGDSNNRTSSRMYSGNTLTITPSDGYAITSAVFTATSEGYASALGNSKWTNASASTDGSVVTVSPSKGYDAFSAAIGATCGFTEVKVYYEEYVEADAAPVWSELPSPETTVGTAIEEIDLSTYVTGHPTPTISVKSSTADPLLYSLVDGKLNFTPNTAGTTTFVFTASNTIDEVEETADATLTITVNAAAAVNTPVLSVNDANVTSNSALVSWTACTGATAYTIEHSASLLSESFGDSLPTGWTGNSISFSSGKSGDGTYCAAFNASGDKLITPSITNPGTISFMYKRSSNTTSWSLDVSYASSPDATEWTNIDTIDNASTDWETYSKTLSITGSVYIKFEDTRSSGTHERYVDLIQITGPTTTSEVSGTSYTFKGLSAETTYAARVQVKDAKTWSNMVTFTTEAATPSTKELTIASGAKYNGRYWTTFYDGSNGYKLPAGAQAFKLYENKLVLLGDNGVVIPKETAVVIISDKASLTLTETNATVTVGDNDLEGSDEAVTVTDGKVDGKIPHVLSINGSPATIGFYKFTGASIPAGKAYVLVGE